MTSKDGERLIDQRLRNRMIEALLGLSEPEEEVRSVGLAAFFNDAFDYLEREMVLRNGVLSDPERHALLILVEVLEAADAETSDRDTVEHFLSSRHPGLIRASARAALDICLARGRYSEDNEQAEPQVDV